MSRPVSSWSIEECEGLPVAVVRLSEPMESFGNAVLRGGSSTVGAFFIMQVPRDYDCPDPAAHAVRVRDSLGLPEDSMGMMTAAEVDHVFNIQESEYGGASATAAATAGLSNHVVAGDVLEHWDERHAVSLRRAAALAGTINTVVMVSEPLSDAGRANILIPMVEAKSAAMAGLGYRETGTTSDAVAVLSPMRGGGRDYAGTGSDIGIAAARAVRSAVGEALRRRGEHPVPEPSERVLGSWGFTVEDLRSMSGAVDGPEEYRAKAESYLSSQEAVAALDIMDYIRPRADSLYADGDRRIAGIVSGMCMREFGGSPVYEGDAARTVAEAVAARIARGYR